MRHQFVFFPTQLTALRRNATAGAIPTKQRQFVVCLSGF